MKEFKILDKFVKQYYYDDIESDDIYTLEDFIKSAGTIIGPDDGGVSDVIVDGYLTNIVLDNVFALRKSNENDIPFNFKELIELSKTHKVELNWCSK